MFTNRKYGKEKSVRDSFQAIQQQKDQTMRGEMKVYCSVISRRVTLPSSKRKKDEMK